MGLRDALSPLRVGLELGGKVFTCAAPDGNEASASVVSPVSLLNTGVRIGAAESGVLIRGCVGVALGGNEAIGCVAPPLLSPNAEVEVGAAVGESLTRG